MTNYKEYPIDALKLMLDDSLHVLLDTLSNAPDLNVKGESWEGYVRDRAVTFAEGLKRNLQIVMAIAKPLKDKHLEQIAVWETTYLSSRKMPAIRQTLNDGACFLKTKVIPLIDNKGRVEELEDDIHELEESLSWLMFHGLTDHQYRTLYLNKMEQVRPRTYDEATASWLRLYVPQNNAIFAQVMTMGLHDAKLHRHLFTYGYDNIAIDQYVMYQCLISGSNDRRLQLVGVSDELQEIAEDGSDFVKEMPSCRWLKQMLSRANIYLSEGYDGNWIDRKIEEMLSAGCSVELDKDVQNKRRQIKVVCMILGQLAEHGVYQAKTDKILAKQMRIDGVKPETVAKYINVGRHNEEKLGYVDWLGENT